MWSAQYVQSEAALQCIKGILSPLEREVEWYV